MTEPADGQPTEWAVNTPEGQVRIADLTFEALEGVEAHCGEPWYAVVAHPYRTAKGAVAIYAAACASNGSTPEPITPRMIDTLFVKVAEDLPEMFEAGIPKAGAAVSTSGSPGAPSGSSGPPAKSES